MRDRKRGIEIYRERNICKRERVEYGRNDLDSLQGAQHGGLLFVKVRPGGNKLCSSSEDFRWK